jgi:hypothetical protein
MVDTNALLSIAFSLIANFTNVVQVPSDAVPQNPADLSKFVVGSPSSPTDLYLVHRKGTAFWISGGVVYRYRSPGSFFRLQNTALIPNYEGTSTLDSNGVVRIAATALQRLIKTKDPLLSETNGVPKVEHAGFYHGSQIPFYSIVWPRISRGPSRGADVEIDGRTGTIVFIHLWDMAFRDPVYAAKIKDTVYTEPPKPPPAEPVSLVRKFHLPQPTTNYVQGAISNWMAFCGKLGVDPGTQTNIADVNWDRTWLYTNAANSETAPVCQIRFRNGACFESIGSTVFSDFAADACYTGFYGERPRVEWSRFTGKIVKRQEDLVKDLETVITEKLGIPKSVLAPFSAPRPHKPDEIADETGAIKTIKRVPLEWRNWPLHAGRTVWISETRLAFSAEFDLETGELKWISFHDPQFIEILRQNQMQPK